jgi:hypothetical protein
MKVIIIYENVPESNDVYIEEVTKDEWKWMQKTHLRYVNTDSEKKVCHKLSKWLVGKQKIASKEGKPISAKGIDHVIVTGFSL